MTATAAVIENALLEFKCMARKQKHFSIKCAWEFRNIILKILDFDRSHRKSFIPHLSTKFDLILNSNLKQLCLGFRCPILLEVFSAANTLDVCHHRINVSTAVGKSVYHEMKINERQWDLNQNSIHSTIGQLVSGYQLAVIYNY